MGDNGPNIYDSFSHSNVVCLRLQWQSGTDRHLVCTLWDRSCNSAVSAWTFAFYRAVSLYVKRWLCTQTYQYSIWGPSWLNSTHCGRCIRRARVHFMVEPILRRKKMFLVWVFRVVPRMNSVAQVLIIQACYFVRDQVNHWCGCLAYY